MMQNKTFSVANFLICRNLLKVRTFVTSSALSGFKDKIVWGEDLNKRPSDLEIEKKGLPKNTPTLGERIRRDAKTMFYAADRKGGYYRGTGTVRDYIPKDTTMHDVLTEGFKSIKEEIVKWRDENKDPFKFPFTLPGTETTEWQFDSDLKRNDWIVTCDSSWGEGYSTASLTPSASGRGALFSGEIVNRPPPDGRIKYAGYANIKSVMRRKSFYRINFFDWSDFTHLTMRVRGDGRTYHINLHTYGMYDVTWFDLWQFPLYTRGGPYWQTVKIPFSKFYFSNKGYIQDNQEPPPLDEIAGIGISLMDRVDGPFALEIEDIGVVHDPHYNMDEEHAYETYAYPRAGYPLY